MNKTLPILTGDFYRFRFVQAAPQTLKCLYL